MLVAALAIAGSYTAGAYVEAPAPVVGDCGVVPAWRPASRLYMPTMKEYEGGVVCWRIHFCARDSPHV